LFSFILDVCYVISHTMVVLNVEAYVNVEIVALLRIFVLRMVNQPIQFKASTFPLRTLHHL
jgi:hypothetical protein